MVELGPELVDVPYGVALPRMLYAKLVLVVLRQVVNVTLEALQQQADKNNSHNLAS